ncbi:MAG TPA: class F sortase [Marmoricola sp.]
MSAATSRVRALANHWWRAVAVAALVVGVISTGWQLADSPGAAAPPPRQAVLEGAVLKAKPLCATGATSPFAPTHVSVEGVVKRAPVLALARDSNDIPGVPPLDEAGKHEFAWDRPPGVMPGSDQGNVLLNAHTWPWTSAPSLGNLMLTSLRAGDRIVLWGEHAHLCYRVTKEVTIGALQPYPAYYATDGAPQIAIMVCSGVRRGPGDWADRTIWFASPVSPRL